MKGFWGHLTRNPCEPTRAKRIVLLRKSGLPCLPLLLCVGSSRGITCTAVRSRLSQSLHRRLWRVRPPLRPQPRARQPQQPGKRLVRHRPNEGRDPKRWEDSRWFPSFISNHWFLPLASFSLKRKNTTQAHIFGHTDIPVGQQRTKRAGKYTLQVSL